MNFNLREQPLGEDFSSTQCLPESFTQHLAARAMSMSSSQVSIPTTQSSLTNRPSNQAISLDNSNQSSSGHVVYIQEETPPSVPVSQVIHVIPSITTSSTTTNPSAQSLSSFTMSSDTTSEETDALSTFGFHGPQSDTPRLCENTFVRETPRRYFTMRREVETRPGMLKIEVSVTMIGEDANQKMFGTTQIVQQDSPLAKAVGMIKTQTLMKDHAGLPRERVDQNQSRSDYYDGYKHSSRRTSPYSKGRYYKRRRD